jgi:hypothetical protein
MPHIAVAEVTGFNGISVEDCIPVDMIEEYLSAYGRGEDHGMTPAKEVPNALEWLDSRVLEGMKNDDGDFVLTKQMATSLEASAVNQDEENLVFVPSQELAEMVPNRHEDPAYECGPEARGLVRGEITNLTDEQQNLLFELVCEGRTVAEVAKKFGIDKGDVVVSFNCSMDILKESENKIVKAFVALAGTRAL